MSSLRRLCTPTDAAVALAAGGLVVHPTVGLWGIAADPNDDRAMARLVALKGVDERAGFITIGASWLDLQPWCEASAAAIRILQTRWQGPVTVVVTATDSAPRSIVSVAGTVAVRVERHPTAAAICAQHGSGLASTSLNRPGETPIASIDAIGPDLAALLDGVIDGGAAPSGQASTIVDMRGPKPLLLRAGAVPLASLLSVVGPK